MNDFKVRLEVARRDVFYYPDVVVSCHPSGIERREKKMSYEQAATLEEYVIVAQNRIEVTVYRRSDGWRGEVHTDQGARLELRSIKQTLSVAEIYEDVDFSKAA